MSEATLQQTVDLQKACVRCPLHKAGSIPVSIPFDAPEASVNLVVMDRPFSNTYSGHTDPRFKKLLAHAPALAEWAVTYATNCSSNWGKPVPKRSLERCSVHRKMELLTLKPRGMLLVGQAATAVYLPSRFEDVVGRMWTHTTGSIVYPVPSPLDSSDKDFSGVANFCEVVKPVTAYTING